MTNSQPLPIARLREIGSIPQVQSFRDKNPAHSPVLTVPVGGKPHPVFGRQPHTEAALQKQGVAALFFYYWKACNLLDIVQGDEVMHATLNEARGSAYEAMLTAKPNNAAEAARQMEVIAAEMLREETTSVIGFAEFMRIAENLTEVTKPILPARMPGKLARGNRLTRVGLLHRYCSFLLEELNTISWALYGERDYLLNIHFYDDAVHSRLRSNPRHHPFFNPAGMTERATRVLKSLKIDTVSVSARSRKGGR